MLLRAAVIFTVLYVDLNVWLLVEKLLAEAVLTRALKQMSVAAAAMSEVLGLMTPP
jgi:hypothetical protein